MYCSYWHAASPPLQHQHHTGYLALDHQHSRRQEANITAPCTGRQNSRKFTHHFSTGYGRSYSIMLMPFVKTQRSGIKLVWNVWIRPPGFPGYQVDHKLEVEPLLCMSLQHPCTH